MAAGLRAFLYRLTSVSLRPGKQAAIVAKLSAGTAQCIHTADIGRTFTSE